MRFSGRQARLLLVRCLGGDDSFGSSLGVVKDGNFSLLRSLLGFMIFSF